MPYPPSRTNLATFKFVMRSAASGRFKDHFATVGKGKGNDLGGYFAYSALGTSGQAALRKMLSCETCNKGLDCMHDHFHHADHRVLGENCELDTHNGAPYLSRVAYLLGGLALIGGADAMMGARGSGFLPAATWAQYTVPVVEMAAPAVLLYVGYREST